MRTSVSLSPDDARDLWIFHRDEIDHRFGLECPMLDEVVLVSNPNEIRDVGVLFSDGILKLPNGLHTEYPSIQGAIAYEVLRSGLESLDLCDECIDDLSMEYARQSLEPESAGAWIDFWRTHSPRKKVGPMLIHNPAVFYTHLFSIEGERGLDIFVREIVRAAHTKVAMTKDEYLRYINLRVRKFASSLDKTELLLVQGLLSSPDSSSSNIAEKMGLSSQWISTKIAGLKDRAVLREFDQVRFSHVGIRVFNVLLKSADNNFDPLLLVSKCPFLWGSRNLTTGGWDSHAVFCIPHSARSISALERFVELARKWNVAVDISEIMKSGTHYCFDSYDPDIGAWSRAWEEASAEALAVTEKKSSPPSWVDEERHDYRYRLDELDIQILDAVRRGASSIAGVRRAVQASQNRVAKRLKRLREHNVIRKRWEIHNIGLNEGVLLRCQEIAEGPALSDLAGVLPKSILSYDEHGGLILIASLPHGGAYAFLRILKDYRGIVAADFLGESLYGGWGFPTELWDADRGIWLCPEDQLATWLSSLR